MGIINVIGGDLYQWDTGRSVEVTPWQNFTIDEVHFMNPNGDNALVVEPVIENNAVIAKIPNILLQAAINIRVFVVMHTDGGERTISDCTFGVIARQKPEDYIYTETEVLNYSNLNRRLSVLEGEGLSNAISDYLDKHPIDYNVKTSDGTIISQNADYAEVGEWVDGNPDSEDRIGYFVAVDTGTSDITIGKATSTSDVRGVTVSTPAFSGNCSYDKFDDNGNLLKQYSYVAVMGIVPVIDNGTCTVNGRCMPSDDGTAIPSDNNLGYHVIDRIDDIHILITVEPGADMIQRIKNDIKNTSIPSYTLYYSPTLTDAEKEHNAEIVKLITSDESNAFIVTMLTYDFKLSLNSIWYESLPEFEYFDTATNTHYKYIANADGTVTIETKKNADPAAIQRSSPPTTSTPGAFIGQLCIVDNSKSVYVYKGPLYDVHLWMQIPTIGDIPTKVSQLENDSGFITEHQSLAGYATEKYVNEKTEGLGKVYVNSEQPTDFTEKDIWVDTSDNQTPVVSAGSTSVVLGGEVYDAIQEALGSVETALESITTGGGVE